MERYKNKLSMLPDHMHDAIVLWVDKGIPPGDFLTALLSNDLMEAFGRADDENTRAMRQWVLFLYNYAPRGCFGSKSNFDSWRSHKGMSRFGISPGSDPAVETQGVDE